MKIKATGGHAGDHWRPREDTGGHWRRSGGALEATGAPVETSSRVQILAQPPKSNPLPSPPGPSKLHLLGRRCLIV